MVVKLLALEWATCAGFIIHAKNIFCQVSYYQIINYYFKYVTFLEFMYFYSSFPLITHLVHSCIIIIISIEPVPGLIVYTNLLKPIPNCLLRSLILSRVLITTLIMYLSLFL